MRTLQKTILNQFLESKRKNNKNLAPLFWADSRVQNFPVKTGQVEMSYEVLLSLRIVPGVSSAPKCQLLSSPVV